MRCRMSGSEGWPSPTGQRIGQLHGADEMAVARGQRALMMTTCSHLLNVPGAYLVGKVGSLVSPIRQARRGHLKCLVDVPGISLTSLIAPGTLDVRIRGMSGETRMAHSTSHSKEHTSIPTSLIQPDDLC